MPRAKQTKLVKKGYGQHEIVIFSGPKGDVTLRGDYADETIWATQAEIAEVFGVDVRTVNEHLKNIYKTKELTEAATIRKIRIVRKEGKREVSREINGYNLDAIISIGYRVNSKTATKFRQWATSILRQHITKGFTINKSQISTHFDEFVKAVGTLKAI